MGYFDLLDSSFPSSSNCWIMLTELPLFNLSSTSIPSEVKAIIQDLEAKPIEMSTFLTGRADMAVVCLTGRNKAIIQDREIKEDLVESGTDVFCIYTYFQMLIRFPVVQGPLTYETLFDNLLKISAEDEGYSRVESLQFLLIEAKASQPNTRRYTDDGDGDGEGNGADEVEEDSPGPPLTDGDSDSDPSDVSGADDDGGGGGDVQEEEGGGQEGGEGSEDGEFCKEREGTNSVEYGDKEVGSGNEVSSLSLSILEESLPQIVSECAALYVALTTCESNYC